MKLLTRLLCGALMFTALSAHAEEEKIVNLYSAQTEQLIRPLLDKFTEESGIKVNLITGDPAALVTRMEQEGENSPADLLLTADIGNIYQAEARGLFKPVESEILKNNIPSHLRDSEGKWYGLTTRARALFFRKQQEPQTPFTYLDLAKPDWKNAILIRSATNVYNQSLMSFMLYHYGEEKATEWAKGIVANLARAPQGGDRDQITALAAGEGKVAVGNTYYYGMLVGNDPATRNDKVKERVSIFFPNQETTGVHVNIRGGGVTAYAKHEANAIKLLEFLSTEEAQKIFAETNMEYPANPKVKPSELISGWGQNIVFDQTPLEQIGALQPKAIAIMDKVGWR